MAVVSVRKPDRGTRSAPALAGQRAEAAAQLHQAGVREAGRRQHLDHPVPRLPRVGREAEGHPAARGQPAPDLAQSCRGVRPHLHGVDRNRRVEGIFFEGESATVPRRRSTTPVPIEAAFRAFACSTISSDGSTPAMVPLGAALASSSMPTPGPNPTSRTFSDAPTSRRATISSAKLRLARARMMPPSRPRTPSGPTEHAQQDPVCKAHRLPRRRSNSD
jgi:hypothetical protein